MSADFRPENIGRAMELLTYTTVSCVESTPADDATFLSLFCDDSGVLISGQTMVETVGTLCALAAVAVAKLSESSDTPIDEVLSRLAVALHS